MLDVIMFIPNIFPTLLHKKLGWGTQNKNHLTLLYLHALAHVRSAATRAQGTKNKSKKAYLHVCLQILIPKAVFAV